MVPRKTRMKISVPELPIRSADQGFVENDVTNSCIFFFCESIPAGVLNIGSLQANIRTNSSLKPRPTAVTMYRVLNLVTRDECNKSSVNIARVS